MLELARNPSNPSKQAKKARLCRAVDDVYPLLYGATLTPLTKKDGGVRPIAGGSTFLQIAGKVFSRLV